MKKIFFIAAMAFVSLAATAQDFKFAYVDMNELWFGIYDFGDYANKQPVPRVDYFFPEGTEKANLKLISTGHNWSSGTNGAYNTGNAAEFYEATHNININNRKIGDQHLWRTCSPNPAGCQPQNGTWTYNRSGWCPGSIAMVWDYDLSSYISNGANIFYEFDPTYIDECHPNYPDCADGQNYCPKCDSPDNPVLRVSGKVVSYSNNAAVLDGGCVPVNENYANYKVAPNENNQLMTSDVFSNDMLTLPEMEYSFAKAFKNMTSKFEFIGFDTCLSGNVEIANAIAPYAKYMIASAEIEPGDGWYYTPIMDYIIDHPDCNGEEVGRAVCDSYMDYYFNREAKDDIVIATYDLEKIDNALIDEYSTTHVEETTILIVSFKGIEECSFEHVAKRQEEYLLPYLSR